MARDDPTLQQRGEKVTATVVKKWRDPAEGRKNRDYNYALEHQDGTEVPGPAMKTTSDRYDVGQKLTVLEDPGANSAPRHRARRTRRASRSDQVRSRLPHSAPSAG